MCKDLTTLYEAMWSAEHWPSEREREEIDGAYKSEGERESTIDRCCEGVGILPGGSGASCSRSSVASQPSRGHDVKARWLCRLNVSVLPSAHAIIGCPLSEVELVGISIHPPELYSRRLRCLIGVSCVMQIFRKEVEI